MAGKPWLGFAIRKAPGKTHLLVQDVAENGPADKAGLRHGDEISMIDGRPVPDPETFKMMLRNYTVNQSLTIQILRDDHGVDNAIEKTCHLIVGERRREPVHNAPPLRTSSDVELILRDSDKLEKASAVFFDACDDDLSGLVTREEFAATMGPWFEQNLGYKLDYADLEMIFDDHDRDRSGFMKKSEFTPVTRGALEAFLRVRPATVGNVGGTYGNGTYASTVGGTNTTAHHPGHPTPAVTPTPGVGAGAGAGAVYGAAPVVKKKTWKEKCCGWCPCMRKKKH